MMVLYEYKVERDTTEGKGFLPGSQVLLWLTPTECMLFPEAGFYTLGNFSRNQFL
jgi:hypothetical protein